MISTIYRGAAIADGTRPEPARDMTIVVAGGAITWMGPDDAAPPPPEKSRVIDAGGATVVPGMVDAHSHITLPGGSHWIDRIDDSSAELLDVAEHNGELMVRSGVRWARDVGSPRRPDPDWEEGDRALALVVRDRWRGRDDRPYVRAAGTWIGTDGVLPPNVAVEVPDGDALLGAAQDQLRDGADLVKLYLDGPDRDTAPFTASEVAAVVAAAHERDRTVTAHATNLAGARVAAAAAVDCIEHASELDAAVVGQLAEQGTFIVPTLAVLESWDTFATTTTLPRFTDPENRKALRARRERAHDAVRLASRAGVKIAAGTDFGGGSLRANQLPWEVEMLVAAGMEPHDALAAATWRGGELLGEPEAGRLRVGGAPAFFLVHGNPLDDPSALWRTWHTG
jgi:imidazolonepropionase-like amidohydrolase